MSNNPTMNINAQASKILTNNTVGVKIIASGVVSSKKLHIALIIDTSGSMEGERITAVIKTIKVLIERLNIGDMFTLIGFNNDASVIASGVTITELNKLSIIADLDNIVVGGGTNMEIGITKLGELIHNGLTMPNSVVILTDGHINEGMASIGGLYSLIKSYIPLVPMYTLGYGMQHNADLLKNIAEKTRGSYTLVEDDNILPGVMGDMLGALKSEVTSNAVLKFPTGWKCLEPINESTDNSFTLGSLILDKPTWVVFNVPDVVVSNVQEGVTSTNTFELVCNEISISFTNDSNINSVEVAEQLCRCQIATVTNNINEALKNRKYSEAEKMASDSIKVLDESEAKTRPLVIKMKAQMEESLEKIKNLITNQNTHFNRNAERALQMRMTSLGGTYSLQRGRSGGGEAGPANNDFSSPAQRAESVQMTQHYTQGGGDPSHCSDMET
jgi:hypothetical protein